MPKTAKLPHQVNTTFSVKDYVRIQKLTDAKGLTKSEFLREAALYYLSHHDRILRDDAEGPVATEMRQFRQSIVRALGRLTFAMGQNIFLTSTILSDALPAEPVAMPKDDLEKLWDESKRYGSEYTKLVSKVMSEDRAEESNLNESEQNVSTES